MNFEEALYIVDAYPRLVSKKEHEARRHYLYSQKLSSDKNDAFNQKRLALFKKRNLITSNKKVLRLLENGFEQFIIEIGKRIKREHPYEYFILRCPKCQSIPRTEYAKQCPKCFHDWRNQVKGKFTVDSVFSVKGRPYVFIGGNLKEGNIQTGWYLDFTHFQINLKAKIEVIEYARKNFEGISGEYPVIGIQVGAKEKKLIKRFVIISNRPTEIITTNHWK